MKPRWNASALHRKPRNVAICSGALENDVIASNEKRSILRSGYLVTPAWRSSRTNGTAACV